MTYSEDVSLPLRQWRVTITEDLHHSASTALLSWRTFPCRADHWDEHRWFTFGGPAVLPITSQEALREALGAMAQEPWRLRRQA